MRPALIVYWGVYNKARREIKLYWLNKSHVYMYMRRWMVHRKLLVSESTYLISKFQRPLCWATQSCFCGYFFFISESKIISLSTSLGFSNKGLWVSIPVSLQQVVPFIIPKSMHWFWLKQVRRLQNFVSILYLWDRTITPTRCLLIAQWFFLFPWLLGSSSCISDAMLCLYMLLLF